jgi:alkylation response protein AidB-like acyl-CoA dehydrogenase
MDASDQGRPLRDPLTRARDVVPLIAAAADEIEARCELPDRVLDALHGAGLFRALLPRAFGGDECEPATFVEMIEAIAQADASTAWCIGQGSGCSMAAAYVKPEVAQEIWGDDPRAVLAWGAGPAGTARIVDGGYRLTGKWQFASGGRHATWLGAHCRVAERDGTPRLGPDGEPAERTMLFRREVADMPKNWKVMGLRGTGSDSYTVEDLFVPDDFALARDTEEDRHHPSTLYRFSTTHLYASSFAGVALGIARGALEAFKLLATQKTPWTGARMMRDNPFIQMQVGLSEAKLTGARVFLLSTLRDIWDAVSESGAITLDQRMAIRMASTFATHQASEVVDLVYREAGATAIFEGGPFERRFRDLHAVTQQVQARTAHFETVGAHLLGLKPNLRFI